MSDNSLIQGLATGGLTSVSLQDSRPTGKNTGGKPIAGRPRAARKRLSKNTLSRLLTIILAATLASSQVIVPIPAFGETNDIFAEANELQKVVEQSAADYQKALDRLAVIEAQIASLQLLIDDLEARLPGQKERSSAAASEYYRLNSTGNLFLELIFGAGSFSDFLANYEYAKRVQNSYLNEFNRTKNMVADLTAARGLLDAERQRALLEKTRAEEALADAIAAREEAKERALEAQRREEEERRRLAEIEAKRIAEMNYGGNTLDVVNGPSEIIWPEDREEFIEEWTARIDRYLAGYPLAGHGRTFAEAAWEYGIDPRWSPAISCTESTKGLYCFRTYNAWGWGSINWPDWDTAIREHVRGLARGYGYTITIAGAKKYCPYNWEHWYLFTLNQMEKI